MVYKFCEYFEIETLKEDKSVEKNEKESQETNDGETDKTDSADDNNSSDNTDSSDAEEIYTTEEVLGRRLVTTVQMGLFDAADGEITMIKVVDGQIYFYWDFYDFGWYTRDELRKKDARKLIDGITDQEILIGINSCRNGKK